MTKKAISSEEFKQLSKHVQLQVLHRDGVHVGKREVGHQDVILFQLYSFYVEIYYREYRKEVTEIVISENPAMLQPYLHQIHISDLDVNGKGE
jgi:hypothetical protein